MQPFDETKLSEVQREQFELMSEREKDLVRKGHPVKIISTETEEEICSFNEKILKCRKRHLKVSQERYFQTLLSIIKTKKIMLQSNDNIFGSSS